MKGIRNRRHSQQSGLAIVEFIICAPLLLFLMFSTMEFGRALMQYNTLTKSVRDSVRHVAGEARFGSTGSIQLTNALITEGQNLVAYGVRGTPDSPDPLLPNLQPSDVTITALNTDDIRVAVAYDYQPVFVVLPGFGVGQDRSMQFTFRAASTMRAL